MQNLEEIKDEFLKKHHCKPDEDNVVLIFSDTLTELLQTVAVQSYNYALSAGLPAGGIKPDHLEKFEKLIGIRE